MKGTKEFWWCLGYFIVLAVASVVLGFTYDVRMLFGLIPVVAFGAIGLPELYRGM